MVTISSTAERRDGVTLVTATVAPDPAQSSPVRVRVEPRLDGPIWPPRRQGHPAAGWDADGFEGTVPVDGRLPIGFASPVEPVDPPLQVTTVEPAAAREGEKGMASAEAIVRGLGDPRPPSLIDPATESEDAPAVTAVGGADSAAEEVEVRDDRSAVATESRKESDGRDAWDDGETPPPAVGEWLASVERRLDRAEHLARDAAVEDATAALRACGGADGALALADELATDAERLRAVEWRAAALAERVDETSVATDALERLR